ncbi:hypothetical protein AcW1_010014 [Taiwanofungus camphoratus]|nr:hypothetical protein AcV7_005359 [Antrodia cinnamomea]KAI0946585.1 hypothetical protein AcW1_010014 [Antrodia cinnamomea]
MESSSQDEHPAQFPHGNQEALASMFSDLAVLTEKYPGELASSVFDFQPGAQDPMDIIKSALSCRHGVELISLLQESHVQQCLDLLDQFIDTIVPSDPQYTTVFHIQQKLCRKHGTFPNSFILPTSDLEKTSSQAEKFGGFADVWMGQYRERTVALKVVRISDQEELQEIYNAFTEVILWVRLHHPNVMPFYGINRQLFPSRLCMVSPWMTHGNIRDYLKRNPDANRPNLIIDVATGLEYLHSMRVVHGDLKGVNILISEEEHACLADFGLADVMYNHNTLNTVSTSSRNAGSVRWMAPELLDPEHFQLATSRPTQPSDIYSFAMVMFEIFSGYIPFFNLRRDAMVINYVISGKRPALPKANGLGLANEVWNAMDACWQNDWESRPTASAALEMLSRAFQ